MSISKYGLDYFGFLHPLHEPDIDYVSEEEVGFHFTPEGEDLMLPYGPALLEVAKIHFAFTTADEGLPSGLPQTPGPAAGVMEERLRKLELALEGIRLRLQQMVGAKVGASPKTLARPLPSPPAGRGDPKQHWAQRSVLPQKWRLTVWLWRWFSQPCLLGLPIEHLKEMGTVLRSKPKRLDDLPRQKLPTKARQGPLSESEEAEDVEEEAYGGGLDVFGTFSS